MFYSFVRVPLTDPPTMSKRLNRQLDGGHVVAMRVSKKEVIVLVEHQKKGVVDHECANCANGVGTYH